MATKTKPTKGKWLTIEQKWMLIGEHRRTQPAPSLAELANAASIEAKRSTATTAKGRKQTLRCPELEDRLGAFVDSCLGQHAALSRRLITWKAKQIYASLDNPPLLKLSDGWLSSFMKRHDLRFREMHGKAGSVDPAVVEEGRLAMQDITRHYALCDIWNMDESGLFYRSAKTRGICKSKTKGLKKDKTRITITLAANGDGSEKREVFFIGRAYRPHCFKLKTGAELGYYYRNNRKAWMTMSLYSEWIRAFDGEMKAAGRDILLLVDGASSHALDDIGSGELTNITVQKLPQNTTSHLQPMDVGIIAALKAGYRDKHMELAANRADPTHPERKPDGKTIYYVEQLQAMQWTADVWAKMEAIKIANCFRKTGIIFPADHYLPQPPERREQVTMSEVLI